MGLVPKLPWQEYMTVAESRDPFALKLNALDTWATPLFVVLALNSIKKTWYAKD